MSIGQVHVGDDRYRRSQSDGPVRICPGTRADLSPLSNSYSSSGLCKNMTEPTLPLGADVWDLDRLRLPAERVGNLETRRLPPRHRAGDPFIRGPVPHSWIASACRLTGAGLRVAMAYRFFCCRFRRSNRWGLDAIANGLRITCRSARRGLHAAELAGLLAVERESGCKLVELALDGWAEFGLSRFSASRGLDTLEGAGLVSVARRPGRSRDVLVLDSSTMGG
jgi:DNA-binding transcriptional ArsR family regulator